MLFSFVAVARPDLPDFLGGVMWYGQSRSTTTVYVPFYAGQEAVPDSYLEGLESKFNFDSAWWPFSFVSNIAQLKWSLMFQDIKAEQVQLESEIRAAAAEAEAKAMEILESSGREESMQFIQDFSNTQAAKAVKAWWDLAWQLIQTYSNGFITRGEAGERKRPGYPEWWLKATGDYENWPGETFTDPRTPDMCGGNDRAVLGQPSRDGDASPSSGSMSPAKESSPAAATAEAADKSPAAHLLALYSPYLLFGAVMLAVGMMAGYVLGSQGHDAMSESMRAPLLSI